MVFKISDAFASERKISQSVIQVAEMLGMYHWMRAHNKKLEGTPHYLIVDENKLQIVHDYLARRVPR